MKVIIVWIKELFSWRTPTSVYVIREVLQLSGGKLEEEVQKQQHVEPASPPGLTDILDNERPS